VRFEISHEFDIPVDAIELAYLSPRLLDDLGARLPDMDTEQLEHDLSDGVLTRRWFFAARVKVPEFARPYVTREMMSWDENSTYDLKKHEASWTIVPRVKPEWQRYLTARGTYSLVARGDGSARIIRGELELHVHAVLRAIAERLILSEVKKAYEAEAASLRELATLV
jgi:hypothetical protein